MLILVLKRANLDQKGPKMGGLDFSTTPNLNFLIEDHKISFYTKNQQNSTNHLETRPSMIGSPERVKIQRSLVQNLSKNQQRLKIIGCFLTFWGVKIPPDGHNKFLGSK